MCFFCPPDQCRCMCVDCVCPVHNRRCVYSGSNVCLGVFCPQNHCALQVSLFSECCSRFLCAFPEQQFHVYLASDARVTLSVGLHMFSPFPHGLLLFLPKNMLANWLRQMIVWDARCLPAVSQRDQSVTCGLKK